MMPSLQHISLAIRVPLLAAGLMVLLAVVAAELVLNTLDDLQDARIREIAKMHVEALSVALGPHVLRDDVWEVYDTLTRASLGTQGQRLVFTAVGNENGRVLAASDPVRAPVDSMIGELARGARSPQELSATGSSTSILLTAPLMYQGRNVGQVLTELDISDLISERMRIGRLLVLANGVATLGLALIGYWMMRRMLMPITRLARRMHETAGAPQPLPVSDLPNGNSELSRLINTYNEMAVAVQAKAETERRLAERERFVSLGRLSSSLAHEVNNPLGGMLNITDTLHKFADQPAVVRQSAELLSRGLAHLRDIVRATLDQNRLDRAGAALSLQDFDDLKLLISPEINLKHQYLDWQVSVEGSLMSGFSSGPMRQIILNLLLNASAAAGQIALKMEQQGPHLELSVVDNGPGLSDEARFRLMSAAPIAPGGGQGLRLVRDLVAELSGVIRTKKTAGRTRISVTLPIPVNDEVTQC